MAPKPPAKTINNGPVDRTNSDKRLQALNSALAQIDKQFGEGSIMRMGDVEKSKLDVIPTSSLALDIALGVGGLPRGRVIEIYGPESSGKCLTSDTIVPTNWGLLSIAEIFEKCGMKASCTARVTDISEFGLKVANEYGDMEAVTALTHNYRRPVLHITSSTGKSVKVTENHPMRVLSENGWVEWKNAADIQIGDTLLGVLGGDPNVEDKITEDEAVLLGYLVGDGHYSPANRVMFSQVDEEVSAEFDSLMGSIFPDVAGRIHDSRPNDTWYNSKNVRTALLEKGLTHVTAPSKNIPWSVRESGPVVQRAFLSALFECDGTMDDSNISLSTASHQLAVEVQTMLATLGIVSSIVSRKVAAYPDNTYYNVSIGSASSLVFLDEIGFRSARRAVQVENTKLGERDFYRHIPNLNSLILSLRNAVGGDREFSDITDGIFRTWKNTDNKVKVSPLTLTRILDWAERKGASSHPIAQHLKELSTRTATYESVVSIEPAGEEPTFDLVVPGTHSFVANGLATHNTTLTLHAAANCQRQGGIVAFIDAEHALDPVYAANIGVNLDELLISQPDTGEQALEIVDMLIRSGGVDLVIVDSVAALTPRAEIEGEMGDSHMGLQARLMSQALRKITGGLNQTETTIIFINQLRDKIGVMFGSPETTTGGKALKFYASVRLDIRRIETLKEGTEAVGNRTRVKVVKNKVSPPFRQAEFDIIFGEGISYEGGIIDMGVDYGLIKKSGAWFTYEGDQLGQGKEKARKFLKDNPELTAELDHLIRVKAGLVEGEGDDVEEEVDMKALLNKRVAEDELGDDE